MPLTRSICPNAPRRHGLQNGAEAVEVVHRRRDQRLGPGPQSGGEPQILGLHRLELGRRLHLEKRALFEAAAPDTSRSGKCAIVFNPTASLNRSIWSVAALRLATTPPTRTL